MRFLPVILLLLSPDLNKNIMPHPTTSIYAPSKASTAKQRKRFQEKQTRDELVNGLQANNKSISSKFFYDKVGSALFEMITELPEYYPTRSEKSILNNGMISFFKNLKQVEIIELGSGDCSKISIVLNAIPCAHIHSITYHPIDISTSAIHNSTRKLRKRFPNIVITSQVADFTQPLLLPRQSKPRLFCFFGSTLGNFTPSQSATLLRNIAQAMRENDQLLLGLDMVKDVSIVEAAYNDSQQITAAFNKNILRVVNALLQTNFIPIHFEHQAFYNKAEQRIEMHLKAQHRHQISSPFFNQPILIEQDETIHTENSYKFTEQRIAALATQCDLKINHIYYDVNKWFGIVHLQK